MVGPIQLKNRITMLPMGTRIPTDGIVNDADIAWHEERARGGVGLIVAGGHIVHPTSLMRGHFNGLIEAFNEAGLENQQRKVSAVHKYGVKIFAQGQHLGRDLNGGQSESATLAPSAVRSPRESTPPHALGKDEIPELVAGFLRSSVLAKKAGFDGYEVGAHHGNLIGQFLSLASNRRTDEYGASNIESRMRFLLEILHGVRDKIGAEMALGVRFSADEETSDGIRLEDTLRFAERLQASGLIDYISLTLGMRGGYVKDNSFPHGVTVEYAAAVKRVCDLPVLAGGRINDPALGERIVAEGKADLVGMGRALIADPELPKKAQSGRSNEIRPCLGFVQDCRLSMGGATCAVNAAAGRESIWSVWDLPPSRRHLRIVIVGGGPAGLEAARLGAELGHQVTLYEAEDELGGQVRRAARAPYRDELMGVIKYQAQELHRLRVDVRLAVTATREIVLADAPDLVILASGSQPNLAEMPTFTGDRVITTWDLLDNSGRPLSGRALLADDGTGFWQVCGAADFLVKQGLHVEFITPSSAIGANIPHESIMPLHRRLRRHGVVYRPFTRLKSVNERGAIVVDVVTGEEREIESDIVIVQVTNQVVDSLASELNGLTRTKIIGDAMAPRGIAQAIFEANRIIRELD